MGKKSGKTRTVQELSVSEGCKSVDTGGSLSVVNLDLIMDKEPFCERD